MGELKELRGAAKSPGSLSIDGKGAFDRTSRLPDWREDSDKAKIPASVAKALGQRLARGALKAAAKRAASKVGTGSRAWTKAFTHIVEHFSERVFEQRATHSVFAAGLRERRLVEPLIEKTLKGPGNKQITKALVHDVAAGTPVVIIERQFPDIIGETIFRRRNGVIERESCTILRVVVDFSGTPVTAYPVTEFFRSVVR
jgi:hypothetical protein